MDSLSSLVSGVSTLLANASLLIALLVGFVLGLCFFTSLWLTVRHLPRSSNPVLLMLGSGLARMAVAVPAFYFVAAGQWQRVAVALLGFVLARSLLILRWRPIPSTEPTFLDD